MRWDIEIFSRMLVARYGRHAQAYALARAAQLEACGDGEGGEIWTVVADAVRMLFAGDANRPDRAGLAQRIGAQ